MAPIMFISSLAVMVLASFPEASGSRLRYRANRVQSTTDFRDASSTWTALRQQQSGLIDDLQQEQLLVEAQIEDMTDMMDEMATLDAFSMEESFTPTMAPSTPLGGSSGPTVSVSPSSSEPSVGMPPSSAPSVSTTPSTAPSVSSQPSSEPSVSAQPSLPSEVIVTPTRTPTFPPSDTPTGSPTDKPSMAPTNVPTASPSSAPSVSVVPSSLPTDYPTVSFAPTSTSTLIECQITEREREILIFGILDQVADSALIRDISTPQGMAADFIIHQDARRLCPDNAKIIQRWVTATVYFSTGGDDWIKCSALGSDPCGTEKPFVNKTAFLSSFNECQWAGISCNFQECVTEIEFEENNLHGTIPSEIGLLSELAVWGMERGGLTGTIPSEIGNLMNLIFLDLDYNDLTGSLPTELYSLSRLTQLDLNDNRLSGNITGVGSFPGMEFLQLHSNFFTGTVPFGVGEYTEMNTFNIHNNSITGVMPFPVCGLLSTSTTNNGGGNLTSLIADCDLPNPKIVCDCCTDCRGAPPGPSIIIFP